MRTIAALMLSWLSLAAPVSASEIDLFLNKLLQGKIAQIEDLLDDPRIVSAVEAASRKRKGMTKKQMLKEDSRWTRSQPGDAYDKEVIQALMSNECALRLKEFQAQSGDFDEIFVTDVYGMNVCQTNKTSDIYQADESWWLKAFAKGRGKSHAGQIEYDESAHSESIAVFVPVRDEKGSAIGVCKAAVPLSSLDDEL